MTMVVEVLFLKDSGNDGEMMTMGTFVALIMIIIIHANNNAPVICNPHPQPWRIVGQTWGLFPIILFNVLHYARIFSV